MVSLTLLLLLLLELLSCGIEGTFACSTAVCMWACSLRTNRTIDIQLHATCTYYVSLQQQQQ